MTTIITAEAGRAAFEAHQRVLSLCGDIAARFLELGAELVRIRDERLYEAMGADSFEAYLGDPDIPLTHTQAYRLLRVQSLRGSTDGLGRLISDDRLLTIGIAKADMIRPALQDATTEEERERIADQAAGLSVSDLRRQLAADRGADVDSAWRETSEWFIRQARQTLRRIEDADDLPAALARWDELAALAMRAQERLQAVS